MEEEFSDSTAALKTATKIIENYEDDVRVKFCHGEFIINISYLFTFHFSLCITALLSEKKDFPVSAIEMNCRLF